MIAEHVEKAKAVIKVLEHRHLMNKKVSKVKKVFKQTQEF